MFRPASLLAVYILMCATAGAQPPLPPGASLEECRVAWAQATTDQQRLAVANAIVAEGQRRRNAGEPGYSPLLRYASSRLARLDRVELALSALHVATGAVESPSEAADAWRMIAQYENSRPNGLGTSQAESAYTEQLRVMEAAGVDPAHAELYRMGVMGLSSIQRDRGLAVESVATRRRLVDLPTANGLVPGAKEIACLENGRTLRAVGRAADAVVWYNRLQSQFPEYGRDGGLLVYIRLEAATCEAPDPASAAYRGRLLQLWNDPALSQLPQSVEIGRQLAINLTARGMSQAALQMNVELYQRFSTRESAWSGQVTGRVAGIVKESLLDVFASGAQLGRRVDAVWAGTEVIRRFPGSPEASLVFARMPCVAGIPGSGCGP